MATTGKIASGQWLEKNVWTKLRIWGSGVRISSGAPNGINDLRQRPQCREVMASEAASTDFWNVEPWPEPVETRLLLQEIITKVCRYIVLRPEAMTATALWTMTAWAHEGAMHSPILAAISVEPDSGKSTLLGVLRFLVPKPFVSVEPTGPSVRTAARSSSSRRASSASLASCSAMISQRSLAAETEVMITLGLPMLYPQIAALMASGFFQYPFITCGPRKQISPFSPIGSTLSPSSSTSSPNTRCQLRWKFAQAREVVT